MPVLLRERRGTVEVLTLNRPEKRNALSVELLAALEEAFGSLRHASADGPRSVVVIGAGPAWCAGLDLTEVAAGRGGLGGGERVMEHLLACPVPVIAAVNGACVTGGLELALACDIRIAGDSARFADTHARVGVHPGWGLTVNLPRAVGFARAREMSFTGNYVDAGEAASWGLVSRVVADAVLLDTAIALGEAMATVDQGILATIRELYGAGEGREAGLAREREGFRAWREGFDAAAVVGGRKDAVIARGREQASMRQERS
jgi:enoyl-CoA hydratase/carnithine racemase